MTELGRIRVRKAKFPRALQPSCFLHKCTAVPAGTMPEIELPSLHAKQRLQNLFCKLEFRWVLLDSKSTKMPWKSFDRLNLGELRCIIWLSSKFNENSNIFVCKKVLLFFVFLSQLWKCPAHLLPFILAAQQNAQKTCVKTWYNHVIERKNRYKLLF